MAAASIHQEVNFKATPQRVYAALYRGRAIQQNERRCTRRHREQAGRRVLLLRRNDRGMQYRALTRPSNRSSLARKDVGGGNLLDSSF
jgi:hypothetical protein